ncbi:MAG: hypothetical protein LJF15_10215 [Acidobacteria bacterium]|jgi:high-affinity Fe2+/Pb2+ permease|nr:hypothetical protein [Acidobacteriota bacterium]
MVTIGMLWLPILVATVLVFIASSVVWMALPYHSSDTRRLPDEASALDPLRKQDLSPGLYRFPWADGMKAMKEPAFAEKLNQGPVGFLTIMPKGQSPMGKTMALWTVYVLVVSVLVAYVTGRVLTPEAHYLGVFRVAGTVAFLAYAGGHLPDAIWWGKPYSNAWKDVLDGLVYGLLTAGAFGWLWPR